MSKVYSFRLDENNPREAQAREVIEAWVEEGYSLRYVIVEALVAYKSNQIKDSELYAVLDQLTDMILMIDKKSLTKFSNVALSSSFLDSVRQTARSGMQK